MDSTGTQVTSRMELGASTYTITDPRSPTQLLIFERLENGGFGRVLRYRDSGMDLEYVYAVDPATGVEAMTVLNYTSNTYIKMSYIEGAAPDAASGVIDSPENILEAGTFSMTGTTPSYKSLLSKAGTEWVVTDPSDGKVFDVYASFPSDEWGGLIRSRGPPEEGSSILADYRYVYDSASRRVYAYDVTNLRYALYDWKDPQTPRLLEQGTIVLDADGNVLSHAATKTYNAEILGPVSVPLAEYDPEIAFASAVSALESRSGVTASGITRLHIVTDPETPTELVVVLKFGETEYSYTYDTAAETSELQKTRTPEADGTTFKIVEYDAEGRKVKESRENADGTLTDLLLYRYETAGEVIIIDRVAHTLRIAVFNADKTIGQTLRAGFFDDEKKIYSLQGSGDKEAKWYTYGPESGDGIMLTQDDAVTSSPVRGPQPGTGGPGWRRPGGENTNIDDLIRQLKSKFRTYQECAEERLRSGNSSLQCEAMLDSVSGLQKKIEDEQYRGSGALQFGGKGGNGNNDLNYHNPAPTPAYIAAIVGVGSAPLDDPNAVVVDNADGTKTISVNGLVEIWRAGSDGWGMGNDVLEQVTETATKTTWYYTEGRASRVTTITGGVETELARYEYPEAGTVNVIQADGARYEYHYTDEKDPFGSGELVKAEFDRDGSHYVESYTDGRLATLEMDGGLTEYAYDAVLNQAVLTSETGTRIVNLGGDGALGTADDYLLGGTDTTLRVIKDAAQNLQSVEDLTNGTITTFDYSGTQVTISTDWITGGVINEVTLGLGTDGALGTSDDRLLYISGIYNGALFAETFDEAGHMLSWEGTVEVARRDSEGRFLRADGTIAMTEKEAAKDLEREWITYAW
ncbi:MAG: hypothetical protein HY767_01915, partial [Candidatus Omnitrophica bacterium]|nr:hypothetical protein [Candidatus Omnitrophota bacterium]